jgi:uncharacterized membrane protein
MPVSAMTLGLSGLDLVALAWFVACAFGLQLLCRVGTVGRHSITAAVQAHRMAWMRNMSARDNRTIDTILLGALSQGNAFFASTSAIAIGGLAAMLGSGDKVQALVERLPYVQPSSATVFDGKVLLLMGIAVFAFFKFAWAFRLSHYASIMIGSTPILTPDNSGTCEVHAGRAARLIGIAGEHANSGLRAFYYAIAAMAWFLHPLAFVAATTWMLIILIRREFFSRSLEVLADRWSPPQA